VSAQPGQTQPIIRSMQPADLDAISIIENRTYEFPWGHRIFSDCLIAGYLCVVLEDEGGIIGYAIISVAAAEGHILNLCVDSSVRSQGYGRQLLEYLLDRCRAMEVGRLFLEVRPSNGVAIALYDSTGFSRLGLRKDYYKATNGREDALVLAFDL
jgi:ribosomal-protein-alanine N-acetyltransferase